jgi:hypothetical protein
VSAVLARLGASVRLLCDRRCEAGTVDGYGNWLRHYLFCGEVLILRMTVKLRRNGFMAILFCWLKIGVICFVRWLIASV